MSSEIAIRVKNLSKCYQIYDKPRARLLQVFAGNRKQYFREFWALKNVSFEIKRGEVIGIVGANGSGKSTLLQMIVGTLYPTSGEVIVAGKVSALLELGAGFNPEFTGRENVVLHGQLMGLSREAAVDRVPSIENFAGIGDFIDQPVKRYSSGMFARLAFSAAIDIQPDILIVDEILAVGDAAFQQKCIKKFYELRNAGKTIIMVSHDQFYIQSTCSQAILLSKGEMLESGDPQKVFHAYDSIKNLENHQGNVENNPSAKISDVKFYGADGSVAKKIRSGDDVEITFKYELKKSENIGRITSAINLYSSDGAYVFGTTSLMQGIPPFIAKDCGEIKIKIYNLKLLSGVYNWRVAINPETNLGLLAEANPAWTFSVFDEFRSVGLVDFDVEWSIGN